jgi:apolipoprotein N-acyltransferase
LSASAPQENLPVFLSFVLAVVSGLLLAFAMPGYDVSVLAWFGFVPVLLAAGGKSSGQKYILFVLAGLTRSILTHTWFTDVLGLGMGLFLMTASGFLYAFILQLGYDLQEKNSRRFYNLLILPVVWTSLEWLRTVLPVTKEWWIEILPKTQWTEPVPLQILSVTGFPGLSFLIMLVNVILAEWIRSALARRQRHRSALPLALVPCAVLVWSYFVCQHPASIDRIPVAANTDLANQDEAILSLGGQTTAGDGYLADTPEMSQAIFDVNAALTREAAEQASPAFIVWGENEFAGYDNESLMDQLKALAAEANLYISADIVWRSGEGLHDAAVLIGPEGEEIGITPKVHLTGGEADYGFVPGSQMGKVYETEYGTVGLAVCWDRHYTDVIRSLARQGAGLVLVPVDDDFNGNSRFPYFGASDSVFRAVENRVSIVTGTTSGISQIISPYGEMISSGSVNERGFIAAETFTAEKQSLYSTFGDWFGMLTVILFVFFLTASRKAKKDR